jgi:hypothetical protein
VRSLAVMLAVAPLILLTAAVGMVSAETIANYNPPSPIPLPVVKVTVPAITTAKTQAGTTLSVLDQVKLLETPGNMPVMFVITPRNAYNDLFPWSLITSVHIRMFSFDGTVNPDASGYLTHSQGLPPKVAGQKPVAVVWEDERDGVLTQPVLEAIYKKIGIEIDPLTAPPLNEVAWNDYVSRAAQHVPGTPTRLIVLAFHSNGSDPDVVTTTRDRILTGVEAIKSPKAPVAELNIDQHPDIASKLIPPTTFNGALLIVYNLVDRKVEAIHDPSKMPSIVEDGFQAFALQNGVPPFLNDRTDVAEAFVFIADKLRKEGQAPR